MEDIFKMIGPLKRKVIRSLKTSMKQITDKDFRKLLKQSGFSELFEAAKIGLDALDSKIVRKEAGISPKILDTLNSKIIMVLESPQSAREYMKTLLSLLKDAEDKVCNTDTWKPSIREECEKIKTARKQVQALLKKAEQKVDKLTVVYKVNHKERLRKLAILAFAFLVSYGFFYIVSRKIFGLPKQRFRETVKALIEIIRKGSPGQKILAILAIGSLTLAGVIAAKFLMEAIKYGIDLLKVRRILGLNIDEETVQEIEKEKESKQDNSQQQNANGGNKE